MSEVHYFSPGPARLPHEVKETIVAELLDTFGIGVSVMEISHRSPQYHDLNQETLALLRHVFCVPHSHEILMTSAGAQQHFSLLIAHLSSPQDSIAYTDTGIWAHLAYEEALASGRNVHLVYDGGPHYHSLGDHNSWCIPDGSKFLHLTVNNTVYGTEFAKIPTFKTVPLVLDMTSALGARTDIPWENTDLIYASAQKNFGIAGVSVVIVRRDVLEKSNHHTSRSLLGRALSYHPIWQAQSILNTPPVVAIFAMNKMLKWIQKEGGVPEMERRAFEKAKLIYDQIDACEIYKSPVAKKDRSRHNFVFRLENAQNDERFIQEALKQGLREIKGYKTVGGMRVSAYNGVNIKSAQAMADFMQYFSQKSG